MRRFIVQRENTSEAGGGLADRGSRAEAPVHGGDGESAVGGDTTEFVIVDAGSWRRFCESVLAVTVGWASAPSTVGIWS